MYDCTSFRSSPYLSYAGDVGGALQVLAKVLQNAKAGQEATAGQQPKQSPEQHSAWDNQVCRLSSVILHAHRHSEE